MDSGLIDAFQHSAWANVQLVRFCRSIDPAWLERTATGSYGTIIETLNHLTGSDVYYYMLLTGKQPGWDWQLDGSATLEQIETTMTEMGPAWEAFIQKGIDREAFVERAGAAGRVRRERAGIVVAQALHHANVHREQVNMVLTAAGIEPPDLDVWMFDRSGRLPG